MRTAKVNINGVHAGHLVEIDKNHEYTFSYLQGYSGKPVSLTMPIEVSEFEYGSFPPFLMAYCLKESSLTVYLNSEKLIKMITSAS